MPELVNIRDPEGTGNDSPPVGARGSRPGSGGVQSTVSRVCLLAGQACFTMSMSGTAVAAARAGSRGGTGWVTLTAYLALLPLGFRATLYQRCGGLTHVSHGPHACAVAAVLCGPVRRLTATRRSLACTDGAGLSSSRLPPRDIASNLRRESRGEEVGAMRSGFHAPASKGARRRYPQTPARRDLRREPAVQQLVRSPPRCQRPLILLEGLIALPGARRSNPEHLAYPAGPATSGHRGKVSGKMIQIE